MAGPSDSFPRSQKYPLSWVIDHHMGPHPLWLAESLCDVLALRPDMRVLDLGCGKAITSIFLANEFGVQVWAVDMVVPPTRTTTASARRGWRIVSFPSGATPIICHSRRAFSTPSFLWTVTSTLELMCCSSSVY